MSSLGFNLAVIVDNRLSGSELEKVIDRHFDFLPDDWHGIAMTPESIKTAGDYNRLLTSESFWANLEYANRVVIFQHDSGILREGIEEFME